MHERFKERRRRSMQRFAVKMWVSSSKDQLPDSAMEDHLTADPLLSRSERRLKRGIDLLGASAGLVLLSPLLALTALTIRCTMGSPVLFVQQRPGLGGRPFRMLKFRTMAATRDASGHLLPDAQRLTWLGRLLRATSLDELPELINVVRGEMSLVGPRPLLMEYLPLYVPEQARRHEMRPGITGWAQINGRNAISWEERFRLDVWYVDHWSLALDAWILLMTPARLMRRRQISAAGHATMPRFRGCTGGTGSPAEFVGRTGSPAAGQPVQPDNQCHAQHTSQWHTTSE
jgi:lipopolysaccharide/colanic/teichoic acid biosynthesis glycosyltransferase